MGESLATVRRDSERGLTVVGLVRDGTVSTDEHAIVEPGDEVFVAGSDEGIQRFERTVHP
ncbi:TrkA C-terminal domain-containing protein [Haloarcula brevis]|uniref:TrkA C-terminal domain-containing protein n=1 Tax=Haloarcula brevis TaxID=3111453 RepID=UPI00300EA194